MDTVTPVTDYIASQLQRMNTNALADGEMLNLLGGEGGVQVDVVFYMVSRSKGPPSPCSLHLGCAVSLTAGH